MRLGTWPASLWMVAVAAIVLYAPTLAGGYVLDDMQAILGHPVVVGEAPLWEAFTREFWGKSIVSGEWSSSWRPLTTLTFAIEHRITPKPWLHHGVNVASFVLLSTMVVCTARRWLPDRAAVVAGLLFVSLPIHVESVASLVGRADVLAAMAALGVVQLLVPRTWQRPTAGRVTAGCLLYLAGLLCKETIALLPLLVPWLIFMRSIDDPRRAFGEAVGPAVALAGTGLGYLMIRHGFLPVGLPPDFVGADNLLHQTGGLARVWGNLAVLGQYTELVFVPLRLCADHTYADVIPPQTLLDTQARWAWLGLAVLAGMFVDGWRALMGRGPGLWVATLLAYLLVGQWVIDLSVIVAERLMLWPSIWLVIALVHGIRPVILRPGWIRFVFIAVMALYSARTLDRGLDWHDRLRLYRSSARMCPAAVHNRFNLGGELVRRGQSLDAVWHFGVAAGIRARYPEPVQLPAFEVEWVTPVEARLHRLPELVEADPMRFWPGLHRFLQMQGHRREAALVRELAGEAPDGS